MAAEHPKRHAEIIGRYASKAHQFDEKTDGLLIEHAFGLFELHAKQRMEGFRSYLIATAIIFAAFAAMWREHAFTACAVIAVAHLVITLVFYMLDVRALQLIRYAESILSVLQAKLRSEVDWADEDR